MIATVLAKAWVLMVVGVAAAGAAPQSSRESGAEESGQANAGVEGGQESSIEQPSGLDSFLRAKLLESAGLFRPAMDAYAKAMEENPDVVEIRVSYASLLVDVGLTDSAVRVLDQVETTDIDRYGLRTLGLALAQVAAHEPARLARAEEVLRLALDEGGDDPNLQLSLAQVVRRQGRLEDAEVVIRGLRQQRAGHPRLVAYHASLLRGLGRLDEAAELFTECAAASFGSCNEQLVEVLVELDRPGDAGAALLRGAADDELDQLLRAATLLSRADRDAEALGAVQRVVDQEPDSVRARTIEAFLLTKLGRHGEAAARYEALLKKDRDNLDLLVSSAWSQTRLGRHEEARRLIERAWDLTGDPSSPEAARCSVAAARIELAAGHPMVAREWLERIGDPDLGGVDLVRLLASSYREAEQWREGMAAMLRMQPQLEALARTEAQAYEAEFRLRGGDERGLARLRPLLDSDDLGEVLVGLQVLQMTERWSDVEREALQGMGRFEADRGLMFLRASALERLNQFDEAEATFSELIADDPDDAASANYLGYMWADRGVRLHEAMRLINRAVELEPDNPAYLDSLGWVHFRLGNLQEAEQRLRRAVKLGRADGTILSHLGEVLLARDQAEEGRRYLLRALDLGCEQPQRVHSLLDGLKD